MVPLFKFLPSSICCITFISFQHVVDTHFHFKTFHQSSSVACVICHLANEFRTNNNNNNTVVQQSATTSNKTTNQNTYNLRKEARNENAIIKKLIYRHSPKGVGLMSGVTMVSSSLPRPYVRPRALSLPTLRNLPTLKCANCQG